MLMGAAFFFVPGIGPVLLAGPLVTSVVAALESAAVFGGLSALGAGLYSLGIPRNSIIKYETQLRAGKFLLLMTAPMEEIEKAENEILRFNAPEEFSLHAAASPSQPEKQPAVAA